MQFAHFTENVGRLKKLEYLNLALNNIERIENLEGQSGFVCSSYCPYAYSDIVILLTSNIVD